MIKRYVHIYADKKNLGDWIAAKGAQELYPKIDWVEFDFRTNSLREIFEYIASINENDLVLIGGGGLLHNCFNGFWYTLFKSDAQFAMDVSGVGVCETKFTDTRNTKELLNLIYARSRNFTVRDELSTKTFDSIFMINVVGCPSLTYIEKLVKNGSLRRNRKSKNSYLLHVIHPQLIAESESSVRHSVKKLANEIGLAYVEIDNELVVGNAEEVLENLRIYNDATYVVSSRLHGCLIATALRKPLVAISNDWKIESFMMESAQSQFVLKSEFKYSELAELLKSALYADRGEIDNYVYKCLKKQKLVKKTNRKRNLKWDQKQIAKDSYLAKIVFAKMDKNPIWDFEI